MLFESSLRPFKVKSKKMFIHIPKEVKYHKAEPLTCLKMAVSSPFMRRGGCDCGTASSAALSNWATKTDPKVGPPGGPKNGAAVSYLTAKPSRTAAPKMGLRGTATSKMQVAADRAPLSARRSSTLFDCLHLRRCWYPRIFAVSLDHPPSCALGHWQKLVLMLLPMFASSSHLSSPKPSIRKFQASCGRGRYKKLLLAPL